VRLAPTVAELGKADLVRARSATGLTVTVAVEVLFAELGSNSLETTFAVLESEPDPVGVTTMITDTVPAVPVGGMVPSPHVTVVVPLHVPCVGVAETKVAAAGRTSVSVTPVAGEGPLFVIVSV
jgi:hypothetical protein